MGARFGAIAGGRYAAGAAAWPSALAGGSRCFAVGGEPRRFRQRSVARHSSSPSDYLYDGRNSTKLESANILALPGEEILDSSGLQPMRDVSALFKTANGVYGQVDELHALT